jgi:cytochrome c553
MKFSAYKMITVFLFFAVAKSAIADGIGRSEKIVNKVCSACHGIMGTTTSPNFPRLAGQQPAYMRAELTEFRNKSRKDADAEPMWGWARSLTDQDIEGIVAYYTSQKPLPGIAGPESLMVRGQEIFETGISSSNVPACSSCHGIDAAGNAGAPRLASQHASYLTKQLRDAFHDATLRPEAVAMHFVVKGLNDEDIKALTTYLQSK